MDITFRLCLPSDQASVPVVRHVCGDALRKLGVSDDCAFDIELAVTEACTNVLRHARGTEDEYEVSVAISRATCDIKVRDAGSGFNHATHGHGPSESSESGRGIYLMRALVDLLEFTTVPNNGTEVHIRKELELSPGSFMAALS